MQNDSFRTSGRHSINSLHLDLLDHLARSFILGAMATASTQRESAVEGAVPRLLEVLQESFPSQSWIRQCLGSFVTEYISSYCCRTKSLKSLFQRSSREVVEDVRKCSVYFSHFKKHSVW